MNSTIRRIPRRSWAAPGPSSNATSASRSGPATGSASRLVRALTLVVAVGVPRCDAGPDLLVGRNQHNQTDDAARSDASVPSTPEVEASTRDPHEEDASRLLLADSSRRDGQASSDLTDPSTFCVGSGPIALPMVGGCTADVAKRAFKFAICSCSDLAYSGVLTTDSFRSETAEERLAGGSVGVNGTYSASTYGTTLGGSLWIQGNAVLGGHDISGDLHAGGDLDGLGDIRVRGDAYLAGDARGRGLTIDGRLFAPSQSSITGVTAAGGVVEKSVSLAAPCDCENPLDVAAVVAYYAAQNDNAAQGIPADALSNLVGPTERTLYCGRYFFRGIEAGANDLTLHVVGRTVLAVEGRIHATSSLRIDLQKGAELDLFVSSDIDLVGPIDFGDRARPAATRIYGAGGLTLSTEANLAANVYLPLGRFVASTRMESWGSLLAAGYELSGTLVAHYDESILDVEGCAPTERACGGCAECANPAPSCIDGRCRPCTKDEACCPPLRCASGRCTADVIVR